jgi:hypothetical protein
MVAPGYFAKIGRERGGGSDYKTTDAWSPEMGARSRDQKMTKHEWSEPDWRELMLVLMLIIVIEIGRRRSESRGGRSEMGSKSSKLKD